VKEKVNDISFLISEIHDEMQSMRKIIGLQHAEICQLNRNSQAQLKEIRKLRKENELLRKRLSKYEQPPKNSGNSSTPPTKECMKDEVIRRTNTLRKPSGKKPDGQIGHEGSTLKLSDTPDSVSKVSSDKCDACGDSLEGCDMELDYITQVVSLPELKPIVKEIRPLP
jgi:regulator of replication initiation timing